MNYKRDPIYRELNTDKPDKQKTLAAALAYMEATPKVKARIPFYKVRRVMTSCLIILFVVLIPVLILNYKGVITLKSISDKGEPFESGISAPPNSADNSYIEFDLATPDSYKDEISSPESSYGPLRSYTTYNGSTEERLSIFLYDGIIPQQNKTIEIEKLAVTGYYTTETAQHLTLIKLYFQYGGINYLVEIYCTGEDRLPYYLSEIII